MPSLPCLLKDLSKELVTNEVPGVKGGFTKTPKRLVRQIRFEGLDNFLTPERSNVCVANSRGGVEIIHRLPG